MAWLLLYEDKLPNISISVPFDFSNRAQFQGRSSFQYPGRCLLRAPTPVNTDYLPPRLDIRKDSRCQPNSGDVNIEMVGDMLTDASGDVLVVSQRLRYAIERHANLDVAFHEVELSEHKKPTLSGPWYLVDFLVPANVILEQRSNLPAVLSPENTAVSDPMLYCRAVDVSDLNFWCGDSHAPRSFGPEIYPDRIAGPKLTYCSDTVYKSLQEQHLLQGWRAVHIEEVIDETGVVAVGSPLDLLQSYEKVETAWEVGPTSLTSKNWTGDFKEPRHPDANGAFSFYFDEDLPPLPIFEFGGLIFASPEARRILDVPGLFAETKLYSDHEMTELRGDVVGYGVLMQPTQHMQLLPGLSRTFPVSQLHIVDKPGFGQVSCNELLAYEAANLRSLKVWAGQRKHTFFANEPTVNQLIENRLITSGIAVIKPVELFELK
ncbi:MAG: hypothetical protein AAFX07_13060 [Pseudomonadota bacterium]